MSEQWVTYTRPHYGNKSALSVTQEAGNKKPLGFGEPREATADEIEHEKAKRREREESRKRIEDFQARQDYRDAATIRNVLEWMTPDENPLSALTPEEWAELRRKLEATQ
jgi:hypothetical protein